MEIIKNGTSEHREDIQTMDLDVARDEPLLEQLRVRPLTT